MIQRSPPKPAMPPHWVYGLLAALGLVASPLALAQTPAVSPVFAMSGSRNIDGVVLGPDGALYGAASPSSSLTGALFYRVGVDGTSADTLYQFGITDGVGPGGALLLGSDNLFYGTAQFSNGGSAVGGGTIFRIAPDGTGFTRLHQFAPSTTNNVNSNPINSDGSSPTGALIEGSDGFLYGVVRFGGPNGTGTRLQDRQGRGAVFTVLHDSRRLPRPHSRRSSMPTAHIHGPGSSRAQAISTARPIPAARTGRERSSDCASTARSSRSCTCSRRRRCRAARRSLSNEDGAFPQAGLTDGGDGAAVRHHDDRRRERWGVIYSITSDGSVCTTLHDFAADDDGTPAHRDAAARNGWASVRYDQLGRYDLERRHLGSAARSVAPGTFRPHRLRPLTAPGFTSFTASTTQPVRTAAAAWFSSTRTEPSSSAPPPMAGAAATARSSG